MVNQQPQMILDDILKIFHNKESRINNQSKGTLSYQSICHEPINLMVLVKQFPYKFEVPQIENFKGKEYPRDHLRQFKYSYYLISNDDVLMIRKFSMTLKGHDLDWYNNFPQHSIYPFEQLESLFLDHFSINIIKISYIIDLTRISQHDNEFINDYVIR